MMADAIAKGYEPCKICKPPTSAVVSVKPAAPAGAVSTKPAATSGERKGCVCKDGTKSSAIGSSACSHHGGVDHWVYK
jgi:hypothetical protein